MRLCVAPFSPLLREFARCARQSLRSTPSGPARSHWYKHLHGWTVAERDPQTHGRETWPIVKRSLDCATPSFYVPLAHMTTLSGAYCEKTTRALGSKRKIQTQKAAENRVPRQLRVRTSLRMSFLLRTFWAQMSRNPSHDWHWWSSDLFCRTVFSMCHSNPVQKKFHDTVVVSCFELMCGRSQRQASSAKFAAHTKMQYNQTLLFS